MQPPFYLHFSYNCATLIWPETGHYGTHLPKQGQPYSKGINAMPEQTDQPIFKQFNDPASVAKRSKQKLHLVARKDKAAMLAHIIKSSGYEQAVVITKTKRDADALSGYLETQGLNATALHANKRAEENEAAAKAFAEGGVKILITTDMILQGLGFNALALIISYDLPAEPVHYISRLGCLSEKGQAVALVSPEEQPLLEAIEWIAKLEIPQEEVEGFAGADDVYEAPQHTKDQKKKPRHRKQKRKTGAKPKESDDARSEKKPAER
ncbi:MAG: ATP-dependent helicase [Thiovulaceae bacterium]|nr:ATP-dependent helicase [Sulfurimonadaceae bacterium]